MMRVNDCPVPAPNARCAESDDAWHYVRPTHADYRYWICICCLTVATEEEFDGLGVKWAAAYAGDDETVRLRR